MYRELLYYTKMIMQRTGGSHALVYILNYHKNWLFKINIFFLIMDKYVYAHFMTIGKFDTLFSLFNRLIL